MKPVFKNNPVEVSRSLTFLQKFCLFLSSTSSAIAITAIIASFAAPDSTPYVAPATWLFSAVFSLVIAFSIDFMIVQRFGKFSLSEIVAFFSLQFSFGKLRAFNAFCIFVLFLIGAGASFVTSWKGSTIASGLIMNAGFESSNYVEKAQKAQDQTTKALEPYRSKIEQVQAEKKERLKKATSSKLAKLAKNGNAWARAEILKIERSIEKEFARKISAAEKAAAEKASQQAGIETSLVAAITKEASTKASIAEDKANGVWLLLLGFGVAPLLGGIVLMLIEANAGVSIQLPAPSPSNNRVKRSEGEDLGFQKMYGENF